MRIESHCHFLLLDKLEGAIKTSSFEVKEGDVRKTVAISPNTNVKEVTTRKPQLLPDNRLWSSFICIKSKPAGMPSLTNRMWFSVTLIDNNIRHHSGQNVVHLPQ